MNDTPFISVCNAAGAWLDLPETWVALRAACYLPPLWVSILKAVFAMELSFAGVYAQPSPGIASLNAALWGVTAVAWHA